MEFSSTGSDLDSSRSSVEPCTSTDSSSSFDSMSSTSSVQYGSDEIESEAEVQEARGGLVIPQDSLRPLFDSSELSLLDSRMLILYFALKHGVTKAAFQDLLYLINLHLPKQVKVFTSIYKLKKFFCSLNPHIVPVTHSYCLCCLKLLDSDGSCDGVYCTDAKLGQFSYIPVTPQLKKKLEDPWRQLCETFARTPKDDSWEEIYDGGEYRAAALMFKGNQACVSFTLNTDGVALFRSLKKSLWPIWLVINELPASQRFSKQNMLLAGLWYGSVKPAMSTFLKPLIDEMNDLLNCGVWVTTPSGYYVARAALLLTSVDLPARCMLSNSKQFNGEYGCIYCEDKGVSRQSAPGVRNWPPSSAPARTHDSIKKNALEAVSTGCESVKGIKGASILASHPAFNMPRGIVIDMLHAVFLGVVLLLAKCWFNSKYSSRAFSIRNKVSLCDKRLLAFKIPDFITRQPKSLLDVTHWKCIGSELRAWVLYYSLPVLCGILPNPYLAHFALLVAAVHILLSSKIHHSDLSLARQFLDVFYDRMLILYGPTFCTRNVHLLSHLADCVVDWGPLWAYSCFPFESMNGQLKTFSW